MKVGTQMFKFHPPPLYQSTKYHHWKTKFIPTALWLKKQTKMFLHLVTAALSHYSYNTGTFDAILVKADETHSVAEAKDERSRFYVATALAFLHVNLILNIRAQLGTRSKLCCSECKINFSD